MTWLIKIAVTVLSVFSFLFLIVYDKYKNNSVDLEKFNLDPLKMSSSLPILSNSNVKLSNPVLVEEKLKKMKGHSSDTFHVIFDFDKTLTKPGESRHPVFNSLEIFHEMAEIPETTRNELIEFWKQVDDLLEDPNLSYDEKYKVCEDTMVSFNELVKKIKVKNLRDAIKHESIRRFQLRDGVKETFKFLQNNSVPITILSGGFGDVAENILQYNAIDKSNVTFIANYLNIQNDRVMGLVPDYLHIDNKNKIAMKNYPEFFERIQKCQNVILVGDSSQDATMADGAPPTANILKIGFLNFDFEIEAKLERYLGIFDIVIIKDETMDVINAVLRDVIQP